MDTQTTYIIPFKKQRITVPIYDLSFGGGGALMVKRKIITIRGVVYGNVNTPCTEMTQVEYNPAVGCLNQIMAAINRVGFKAGEASFT